MNDTREAAARRRAPKRTGGVKLANTRSAAARQPTAAIVLEATLKG
jgi:hypothetical protein